MSFIVPIRPIIILDVDKDNIFIPVLYDRYPIDSIVSSLYPCIYILLLIIKDIIVNSISNIITEINEDIVFLFIPFKKNKIIVLIIIQITIVGIVGLKPHPTIIININSRVRFMYIVKNVFIPLFPPISIKRLSNIKDNAFIII